MTEWLIAQQYIISVAALLLIAIEKWLPGKIAAHLPTVVVVSRHAPGKQPTARFHASQYKRYNKLCGWHDAHDDCANVISLSDYVGFGSVTNIRFGNYSVLATIPFHE